MDLELRGRVSFGGARGIDDSGRADHESRLVRVANKLDLVVGDRQIIDLERRGDRSVRMNAKETEVILGGSIVRGMW